MALKLGSRWLNSSYGFEVTLMGVSYNAGGKTQIVHLAIDGGGWITMSRESFEGEHPLLGRWEPL